MARNALAPLWHGLDGGELRVVWPQDPRGIDAADVMRAERFIAINRPALDQWKVGAHLRHGRDDRGGVRLELAFDLGSCVGAIPLRSPRNGKVENGLLIEPRFGWAGVGNMLSATDARVMPTLPLLPLLPRGESGVPPWVISAVVLARLETALHVLQRRFVERQEVLDRPRGRVRWDEYLTQHLAQGRPDRVPCVHAPLGDDDRWLAAIHAAILQHSRSLASVQRDALIVRRLLVRCETLRQQVQHVPPKWDLLRAQTLLALDADALSAGLEALQWSHDHRGLAGWHPNGGLPWRLPMEQVFEAWVEVLAQELGRHIGGVVRAGRRRETLHALQWTPPYRGSQRYLLPDIEIAWPDKAIVIDAKYKAHWEEIDSERWFGIRDEVRDAHRADLLQVLAYAAVNGATRLTCVLMYPCRDSTWTSLCARERSYHVAEVPAGARTIRLILAAVPLSGKPTAVVSPLLQVLRDDALH